MFHIDKHIRAMRDASPRRGEYGFSLIEVMVATSVMLIVVGAVFSLVRDSMKVAMNTYEMTDAQQNLRTAQEFINRDIMNAGDGLKSVKVIKLPAAFISTYVTLTPTTPLDQLSIFTSDNAVPAGTAIAGAVPAANIRAGTDRQTMMEIDPDFNSGQAISLLPAVGAISVNGGTITIPGTLPPGPPLPAMTIFNVGEIYFISSGINGTYGTITAIDAAARTLSFSNGDAAGLNNTGAAGNIRFVSGSGTKASSLQRMKIIQYYVTDTNLLMRRVFGIQGAGNRASIVAEHVLDVQFNYSLIVQDLATGVVTPSQTVTLANDAQAVAVRQVEVRVTVETPHPIQNGTRQQLTTTTSTSVRNMQFRNAQ